MEAMMYVYRMWTSFPLNLDQMHVYLVRYADEDDSQEAFTSSCTWQAFPRYGVIEPCLIVTGLDFMRGRSVQIVGVPDRTAGVEGARDNERDL